MSKFSLLTLIIILSMNISGYSQKAEVKAAFLEKWNNSSAYLIEMAEQIPDSSMEYRPTSRQMTIREQLLHIRSNMLWLGDTYFNTNDVKSPNKENPSSKQELVLALKESFKRVATLVEASDPARLQEEVEFFAGPKTRLQILNLLQDHVTHHRGQLIVYMNLLNIEPPRYSGW
ncbi:DinB family protein [Robertkochia marina]|uniref:DinB family protein n=1 Tax=Robertkochia marina TaxID=1227945 RepID=A0A4S3M2X4_9FLAO|nr:DinB family protein [Robertkochia marina]THD69413.1 DinB family protein [Robertkochia marina]TRZ47326.1 DinB family protein [Robertkochia marina]